MHRENHWRDVTRRNANGEGGSEDESEGDTEPVRPGPCIEQCVVRLLFQWETIFVTHDLRE